MERSCQRGSRYRGCALCPGCFAYLFASQPLLSLSHTSITVMLSQAHSPGASQPWAESSGTVNNNNNPSKQKT